MAKFAIDIRSVLIPMSGQHMLLPNATVAEVITFSNPDPFGHVPEWILGRVTWRGWRVPVISLSQLAGWSGEENRAGAKIAVLKGLGGHPDMPFMAVVTQGFPRLVTVTADSLQIRTREVAGDEEPAAAPEPAAEPDQPAKPDFEVSMDFADLDDPDSPVHGEPSSDLGEAAARGDEVQQDESPAAINGGFDLPEGFDAVKALVRVNGEDAIIPDLIAIEKLLAGTVGREALRSRG